MFITLAKIGPVNPFIKCVAFAIFPRKLGRLKRESGIGENLGRSHREARSLGQLKNMRPNQSARLRIHHARVLREWQPFSRPFRMDLEAAQFKLKAELRLKFADGLKADVAKGTDEVREHLKFESHSLLACWCAGLVEATSRQFGSNQDPVPQQ